MELDEQLFRDEAFDAYAWLEEAVIDRGGRVPELAALVPQLALLSQSLTASIHGTLHQLTLAGPQLQAQLDAMQRATAPLAQQLESVVSAGAGGKLSSSASTAAPRKKDEEEQDLQHLLELHEAKERLQSCSKALVEAARWEKNVRACAASIDGAALPVADAGDAHKGATAAVSLADRVNEMHKSLEILKDMPGADDRKRTMERLSAQIEASLKPKLDEYLQAAQLPVAQVQFCRAVLASIGRADHVVQAYCQCRPAQIHRLWYSYSAGDSGPFAAWLESSFYRDVLRMMQRESEHAADIFGAADAPSVLVALLENTLAALKDSFRDRLKKDFAVNELLRAFQASCAFVGQVAKALRISTAGRSSTTIEVSDADEIVDSGPLDQETAERVLMSVLTPYQTFFTNYAQFAGDALARKLTALVPRFSPPTEQSETRGNAVDDDDDDFGSAAVDENVLEAYALRVEDVSNELWGAVEDSVRVCYEFSAGAAFPEAVRVVAQAVEQLTQRLSAAIPAIRQAIGVEANKPRASESHGMLVTDWGKFHSTLALLRACGTLESDLASVEARLSVRMCEQVQKLFDNRSEEVAGSHKTSPQAKRKEFMRRRSGSNVLSLAALATEPSRVATSAVMKWLKEEPDREKALTEFVQDLVVSSDDRDAKVFVQAHTSLTRYTRQVQTLVYDSVFAPIAHVLRTVPLNECWIKTPDASLGDLPTFSTLPQEYITMVADLLLSLLPQLEPFVESSSLQKAAAASLDAHKVCAREWATLGQLLRLSSSEIDVCERIFEISLSEDGQDEPAAAGSDAATFVDIWTSAVASGTTAALLTAVAKIPSLSPLGAKQLEADIGYFRNVLNALSGGGSDRNFLIVGLQTALQVPDAEYAVFVEKLRLGGVSNASGDGDDSDDSAARASSQVVLRLHETLLAKRQLHHAPASSASSSTKEAASSSHYY